MSKSREMFTSSWSSRWALQITDLFWTTVKRKVTSKCLVFPPDNWLNFIGYGHHDDTSESQVNMNQHYEPKLLIRKLVCVIFHCNAKFKLVNDFLTSYC